MVSLEMRFPGNFRTQTRIVFTFLRFHVITVNYFLSDGNSHGTHTMGTIVGINGIGVAPGAQWIHCRCGTTGCPQSAATACGQWIMCPTQWDGSDPDCSKAPSVVSNSWGSSGGDYWFEATTEAWVTAGIVPFFSNGNSGTSCGRVGSPGDYRRVIGVGSTNVNNQISDYSSAGPAVDGRIKPGKNIYRRILIIIILHLQF